MISRCQIEGKKIGGDPNFLTVCILLTTSDFVHQLRRI